MLGELRRELTLKTPHSREMLQQLAMLEGEDACSRHSEDIMKNGDLRQVGPRMETYRSRAPLVGMLRAKPRTPVCWKYGMLKMLAAMTATESEGFTKNPCLPRIMFRSFGRREIQSKTFSSNNGTQKQRSSVEC